MSDREYPLYTIKNNCVDCYKCVRRCPVKAIKIEDGSAQIVPDLCIACGTCYRVCPAKAKQPRNDLTRAKHLIESGKDVYVSLAPSWIAEFDGLPAEKMIASLRRLGFRGVGETAAGAEEVSAHIARLLGEKESGLLISTACPAVVEYVRKYLPEMTPHLTPLSSPLLAHCRMLKDKLGKDIEVVFVGPCIAKKLEADAHPELLSLSLSFGDIRQWFREAGIFPEEIRTSVYDKFVMTKAEEGTAYPIEGGMIETVKPYTAARNAYMMQVSGIQNIKRELAGLKAENFDRPVFIECLACHGGCVAGPCMSNRNPGFDKRLNILKHSDFSDRAGKREPQADISLQYGEKAVKDKEFGEAEIKRALAVIGKYGVEDELNCGGCGYDTCRNFARAMLSGKAEPEMCVSNMKQQAQRKANALLRCIPSPIVIADSRLNIIEYNDKFAETFWSEAEHGEIYERNDLRGADLRDFIDFTNLFSASLDLEQDIRREHVRFGDRLFDVVVFNIDKKQIVGGIIQDVTKMEMKKERIAEKAKDVIRKNLATVQQIACTLGEHMAETEILLRSIAEDYAGGESESSVEKPIKSYEDDK
ncbi:MAG: [Fe-Fe] hydrogenase large subunit C-terminal domain-containing protein [Alphaproteobacteria bacterium]|jgi:putative PAS/PAC sensor protein